MPLLERIQPEGEAPAETLAAGTVLHDRYRVESLRRGGEELRSYLVTDTKLGGRRCLVQEWVPSSGRADTGDGDDGHRFRAGAEARARLTLPQLPPVLDIFAQDAREYLVLGLAEGIQTAVGSDEAERIYPEKEALGWTQQVLDALQPLLQLDTPIAAQGLEPAGVGRRSDGSLILADVGFVAAVEAEPSGETATVREVGRLLYQLLAGRAASEGGVESPRAANPELSAEVDAIVVRALAVSEEQRYPSLDALRSDLAALIGRSPEGLPAAAEGGVGAGAISPLWTFKCQDEVRSTPASTDGAIFVGAYDGRVYALNPADGQVIWEYETEKGIASSPHLGEDMILFGSEDGVFYAVGARTGRLEWTCPTGGKIRSSGRFALGHVFFGSDDGGVYAARSDSGRVVWKAELAGPVRSSPAVLGDVVVVGCDDGHVYALNTSNGEVKWRARTAQAVTSSPALQGGLVIVGSGDRSVYGLDVNTGWERWRYRTGGSVISSPAIAENVVYVGSYDKKLYALDAETGRERWAFEADGPISSSPQYSEGTVYFGGVDGSVYAVDAETGEQGWRYETGGPVPGSPTILDRALFIGSTDRMVYAIPV
ncbi:MAG: PQQ-binding-like beta-propeller repeat protein [Anaerolineae bacterium]